MLLTQATSRQDSRDGKENITNAPKIVYLHVRGKQDRHLEQFHPLVNNVFKALDQVFQELRLACHFIDHIGDSTIVQTITESKVISVGGL